MKLALFVSPKTGTIRQSHGGGTMSMKTGVFSTHGRIGDVLCFLTYIFPPALISAQAVEGKNLWSLLDTLKHHIPIPFSLTQLMALYFGTDMLKAFKGTAFHDSLESLSQKIKATLPPDSMKYLKNVEQTLQAGVKPYKDYARFKEIINRVNEAALQKRTMEMVYYTMSRKKEGKRKADPYPFGRSIG
jgi:hypothetical protein